MPTTTTERKARASTEYRAIAIEPAALRARADEMPTMVGYAAVFNQWTEINSVHEGRFLERFAPGAFARTIREDGHRIKAILEHGFDPSVGDKPLGRLDVLQEDDRGLYVEVPLLDTSYNRDIVAALESDGLYGMSFRFRVRKGGDSWKDRPGKSAHNPNGLPERTVTDVRLMEVSLTVFPAYQGTSAGVRAARTQALAETVKTGKPWTSARRKALLRTLGRTPKMSADERHVRLAELGLKSEPMSASERKRKLRGLRLLK